MGKKSRSARGELVDFDLLKIKQQMASAPPPIDVRQRQDFIEQRLRRRLKKVPTPVKRETSEEVAVDPKMPATEEFVEEPKMIEETARELVQAPEVVAEKKTTSKKSTSKKKTIRQKARPTDKE